MSELVAFLPCRKGSQRVVEKNTRPFARHPGGLLEIKLGQLERSREIDRIVVSTNDEKVFDYATAYSKRSAKPLSVMERPDHLGSSSTSTDEVIRYVPTIIPRGTVLWTHVTSPFVDESIYDAASREYRQRVSQGTHDSLMSVTALRTFIWRQGGPVNYDRGVEKWPRTQTLEPLYEVNSAIFMVDAEIMASSGDRIGSKPFLFEMDARQAMDIDWEEDFFLAEQVALLKAQA